MVTRSDMDRSRTERERGWILRLLFFARPRALEIAQLRGLLDRNNYPMSSRRLAEQISYLCEFRLVKVELGAQQTPLDEGALARALSRYADSDTEGLNEAMSVRLTAAGVNFQEGVGDSFPGIARIE